MACATSRAVVALTLLAVSCAVDAQARAVAQPVQLDGDAPTERVERVLEPCPGGVDAPRGPEACGYLRIVDGPLTVPITPPDQRPRRTYGWMPDAPVLRDLTGDGRPEIIWKLNTSRGTGSSPVRVGVHRWTGTRAVALFATSGLTRTSLPLRLDVLPARKGLRELRLVELVYGASDPTCCPGHKRTSRYRFNGRRMVLVPGSKHLIALHR